MRINSEYDHEGKVPSVITICFGSWILEAPIDMNLRATGHELLKSRQHCSIPAKIEHHWKASSLVGHAFVRTKCYIVPRLYKFIFGKAQRIPLHNFLSEGLWRRSFDRR